jgi:hypothetical protein
VLAEVRELWRPLRSQWLAERVVLSLEEPTLRGLALRRGAISVPVWESLLPAQVLADGLPLRVEELGDFLGDLLLSKGLMAHPVWLALPRPVAHWRVIEWPFDDWPDAPLEALRTVDPELGLPFALADAAIDLQPLSGVPRPGQPLRSLLIAAPRQLVEAWIAVFAIAGATLERLVPAQVCLRQALLPALEPQQDVLVLQCNGARCAAGLWRQGMPLYERQLDCDDPQLPAHLAAVLDYYGSRDPGFRASQLWLAGSLRDPAALARALGLPLRPLICCRSPASSRASAIRPRWRVSAAAWCCAAAHSGLPCWPPVWCSPLCWWCGSSSCRASWRGWPWCRPRLRRAKPGSVRHAAVSEP